MDLTAENVGLVVGGLTVLGVVFSAIKGYVVMKEQVRTLFRKVEDIEKSKDRDVSELKAAIGELRTDYNTLKDVYQEGNKAIIKSINDIDRSFSKKMSDNQLSFEKMVNEVQINLLEKFAEAKKR